MKHTTFLGGSGGGAATSQDEGDVACEFTVSQGDLSHLTGDGGGEREGLATFVLESTTLAGLGGMGGGTSDFAAALLCSTLVDNK